MTLRMARSLRARRFSDWGTVDTSGSIGGILLFWDKRKLEVIETVSGVFSVSCSFRNVEDGFQWIFTGVYGQNRGVLGVTLMLPSHPVKTIRVEELLGLCAVSLLFLTTWGSKTCLCREVLLLGVVATMVG